MCFYDFLPILIGTDFALPQISEMIQNCPNVTETLSHGRIKKYPECIQTRFQRSFKTVPQLCNNAPSVS